MKRELDFRIINTDRHFAYVEITKQSHVGKGFNNGSDCLVMNYPDPTRQSRLISQVHPSYETLQNGACAFYVRGENAALDFRSIKIPLSKLSDFYNLVEKWLSIVDYPPVAVAVAKKRNVDGNGNAVDVNGNIFDSKDKTFCICMDGKRYKLVEMQ